MQWLIANMWMALAAATVLGLLFGFSFRGLLVGSRIRKAQVEREIARTELTQTKAEVEALYSAQRKRKEESAQAVGGDDTLQEELAERESRIASLGEELAAARDELEGLKTEGSDDGNMLETAGAAVAGAVVGAVLTDDNKEELTELRDRNVWLEERVAALEADVSAASETVAIAAPAETESVDQTGFEKLNWQNAYLRQRVDALEDTITRQPAAVSSAAVPIPVETDDEPAANDADAGESDEELARLRWRNRYLEGRLAYFEEGEAEAEAADAPGDDEDDAGAAPETEAEAEPQPEPEPEAEAEADDEAESDADVVVAAAADDDEVHPSDAMLAELEGTQPEQIEKPENGGDDLTAITGIGPRIGEVLNELGIYSYEQIANWTPENETWVENHLSFKGRVSRENWVEQAKALMA